VIGYVPDEWNITIVKPIFKKVKGITVIITEALVY
jgi:hypothetical protein